jgi:hypothetical protein
MLAPPLPPDTRPGTSNQYPLPPPEAYYEVEFKRGRTEFFAGNAGFNGGEYVKVRCTRKLVDEATAFYLTGD